MSFWNWLTRRRTDRGWPGYIINGRIRTSTAALILAFIAVSWVHNTYQPPAPTPVTPETAQVVPPGFMPDPEYTWVPRTNVETQPRTTSSTPTTTTSSETETTSTSPTETTGPTTSGPSTTGLPTATTVIDPDGPGPLPPTTLTQTPVTSPGAPVPNRSGLPTTTTTTVLPGAGPVSTTPVPAG